MNGDVVNAALTESSEIKREEVVAAADNVRRTHVGEQQDSLTPSLPSCPPSGDGKHSSSLSSPVPSMPESDEGCDGFEEAGLPLTERERALQEKLLETLSLNQRLAAALQREREARRKQEHRSTAPPTRAVVAAGSPRGLRVRAGRGGLAGVKAPWVTSTRADSPGPPPPSLFGPSRVAAATQGEQTTHASLEKEKTSARARYHSNTRAMPQYAKKKTRTKTDSGPTLHGAARLPHWGEPHLWVSTAPFRVIGDTTRCCAQEEEEEKEAHSHRHRSAASEGFVGGFTVPVHACYSQERAAQRREVLLRVNDFSACQLTAVSSPAHAAVRRVRRKQPSGGSQSQRRGAGCPLRVVRERGVRHGKGRRTTTLCQTQQCHSGSLEAWEACQKALARLQRLLEEE